MRESTKDLEQYRIKDGTMPSVEGYGFNGAFRIPYKLQVLKVLASDAEGWKQCRAEGDPWEHVSVSIATRCPIWEEMEFVRELFWRDDETVMQLSVARSEHVNVHPYCLHMWRPVCGLSIPLPPSELV